MQVPVAQTNGSNLLQQRLGPLRFGVRRGVGSQHNRFNQQTFSRFPQWSERTHFEFLSASERKIYVLFDTQPDMKLVAEYLEHALNFERMATNEKNPGVKAAFEQQAAAYRRLAEKRAEIAGLQLPPQPPSPSN
jgi:hypothetical protein